MNITSDNFLDQKRQQADPIADSVITDLIEKNHIESLKHTFHHIVYNRELDLDDLPQDVSDYFHNNSKLPVFADHEKLDLAGSVFARFGPSMILAYFCKSLPECYACGRGAEVLGITGRLTEHTRRRIAQTAQFVIDVMSPGEFKENGKAIIEALKVRLVLASIRFYLKSSIVAGKTDYSIEESGEPINQEDLTGTMLAFSVVVIQGIEKLGIKVSDQEKEAILHLWKVIGHLVGIQDDIFPDNFSDAERLWDKIKDRLFERSNAGVDLNNHLIMMLEEIIPGKEFDGIVQVIMEHILDERAYSILEVEHFKKHKLVSSISEKILERILRFDSESRLAHYFTNHVNLALMNGLKSFVADHENIDIYVPPGLHKDWNESHKTSDNFLEDING